MAGQPQSHPHQLDRSLLIESVNNGYIVRPFTPDVNWCSGDRTDMYVYVSKGDLAEDLPNLLQRITPCNPDIVGEDVRSC